MTARSRTSWLIAITLAVMLGAGGYALATVRQAQERRSTAPQVPTVTAASRSPIGSGPRIVFRHTGLDSAYGAVAWVPLTDTTAPRTISDITCDRVAAWERGLSCLRTRRGVVTRYEALTYSADGTRTDRRPLPGLPSRTRFSDDGALVATTSFVTGHSYMTVGFSTATEVHRVDGTQNWGNLEEFTLVLDGDEIRPADRNVWGVTFADDNQFYATVATGGRTWLVRGDLATRTLTSVAENAECPAISPDGRRVAFKVDVADGSEVVWQVAVLDLASGERLDLGEATRGLDDQVAWLDDQTLLYALPRERTPGVSDIWAVPTVEDAQPRRLIEEASSATVVR